MKVIWINQIRLIVMLNSIIFLPVFFLLNLPNYSLVLFFYGLLYLFPLLLQNKVQPIVSINLTIFLIINQVALYCFLLNFDSGAYLYLFPLLMAIGYTLPLKRTYEHFFHLFYAALILGFFLLFREYIFKPDISYNSLYWVNFTLCFANCLAGSILYSFRAQREIDTYNKKLKIKNRTQSLYNQAIEDKEVLIAEIHHRVKNNLAVIISMINLQLSEDLPSEANKVLQECSGRISSMSLVHEKLYNQKDLTNVDIKGYIFTLAEEIQSSYRQETKNININFDVDEFKVNINHAVPIGLILNELISNAFKHAFKGVEKGELEIKCNNIGQQIILTVNDNGNGFDIEKASMKASLGLTIIESLTEQLDATSEYTSREGQGTKFIISFIKQ